MHGVVGPVRGDRQKAARPNRLGGELGEFGLDQAALVVPGLVPGVREETHSSLTEPAGSMVARTSGAFASTTRTLVSPRLLI